MKTLAKQIRENKSKFNSKDEEVCKFIKRKKDICVGLTLSEFSKILAMSPSTITRFCKKIGLRGYSDLKFTIKQESNMPKTSFYSLLKSKYKSINYEKLYSDVFLAKSIYVFYLNKQSKLIADYLVENWCGNTDSIKEMPFSSIDRVCLDKTLRQNTAFIFILLNTVVSKGAIPNKERLMRAIKKKKIRTVLLSDQRYNSFASFAEYKFLIFNNEWNINNQDSKISCILKIYYFIDLLNSYFKKLAREKASF